MRKMIQSMRAAAMTALTAVVTMTSLVPVAGWAQTPGATPVCAVTAGGITTEYFLQADGGTYEDAMNAFLHALKDLSYFASPTLILFKDIDLGEEKVSFNGFTGTLTLDLNGCTIKSTTSVMDLSSGCEMIINDRSSGKKGQVLCTGNGYSIENNGKLTLKVGSFSKLNNKSGADLTIGADLTFGTATVTGEDVAINNSGDIVLHNGSTVTANTTAIINSGLITVNNGGSVTAEGTAINNSGNLTLNSGSTVTANNTAIINSNRLSVYDGATVTAGSKAIDNTGKLDVNSGTTITATGDGGTAIYSSGSASDFAISGGTITASGSGGTGIFVNGTFYLNGWPTFGSGTTTNACDIAFASRYAATFTYGIKDKPAQPITVQHMTLNSETGAYVVDDNLQEPFVFATSYGTYVKYSSGDQKDEVIPLAEVFCLATDQQEITLSEDKRFAAFVPTDLKKYTVDAIADRTYDGTAQKPAASVYCGDLGTTYYITDGLDFAYANNTDAYHSSYTDTSDPTLAPTVTITSKTDRNFTGTVSKTFQIAPKVAEIAWSNTALTYNGSAQVPTATVWNEVKVGDCDVTVGDISGSKAVINTTTNRKEAIYSGDYSAYAVRLSNPNYRLPVTEEATAYATMTTYFTISPLTAKDTPFLAWDEDAGALAMTSHDAQVLEGWETEIGTAGQETFYLASGTLNYDASNGSTVDARLMTNGDVHLILADGATMNVNGSDYGIKALKDENQTAKGHLYIHSQGGTGDTAEGTLNVGGSLDISVYAVYSQRDLTIDGGNITLTATTERTIPIAGIFCDGKLAIHGGSISADVTNTGYLMAFGIGCMDNVTITGGDITLTATTKGLEYSSGLVCRGNLTVSGCKIKSTALSENSHESYGIAAVGAIDIGDATVIASGTCKGDNESSGIITKSTLTIDKGTVTATAVTEGNANSYGILAYGTITSTSATVTASSTCKGDGESYGIYAKNGLTIDKGSINANAEMTVASGSYGIYCENDMTATSADITAIGNGPDNSSTDGIHILKGNLTITGCTLTAKGMTNGGVDNNSYGIICVKNYAEGKGNVTIVGGNVTVVGGEYNIDARDDGATITLDWLETSDFIRARYYHGTVKIPAGRYFANFDDQGSVDMIYGNAATAGDYTFGGTFVNIYGDGTLHPVGMIPTNPDGGLGEQYIGYSEQAGDMAIVGGTAQSYAIVGYDFSTTPAVVYTVPVSGIAKGGALVLGPAGAATALPDEVGVVVMSGSAATAIENSFAGANPLRNFIAAPADGVTTLDQQIAQTLGTGTPGEPDYVPANPADYIVFMIVGGQFRPVSRTATSVLPVNTAVLAVSKMDILTRGTVGTKPAAARRITFGDTEATGIRTLPADTDGTAAPWYTLDGRKVSTAPTRKGIYIHNGTKYVVR